MDTDVALLMEVGMMSNAPRLALPPSVLGSDDCRVAQLRPVPVAGVAGTVPQAASGASHADGTVWSWPLNFRLTHRRDPTEWL
jgi:hypothetical protein